MGKADRILGYFPAVYRALDETKLLSEIVRALAAALEEADTHLFRIQRAHRLPVAEEALDIVRLAGALNLSAFHFEDILTDQTLDAAVKLHLLRRRVRRIAQVHLVGLGTPHAVLQAAAIFLNGELNAEEPNAPLIRHLDAGGFSHRASIQFAHLLGEPSEQLYLHEAPLRREKAEPGEVWQLDSWTITNANVEASRTRFVIRGIGERTVLPSIFCPETQEGLFFNGIVPDGKTLVMDKSGGARLDNLSVDEWVVFFRGGIHDFTRYEASPFVVEEFTPDVAPFDGDLENLSTAPFQTRRATPAAPVGRSTWHFHVTDGVYDGADFDFAVYMLPEEEIGIYDQNFNFDECIYDMPGSGIVGMAWDGRVPCAFKLLLPPHVPYAGEKEPGGAGAKPPGNFVGRVGTILPRFKAAGIRGWVDTATDAWVLGQSVLRDQVASEGEGSSYHATRLWNDELDLFVS